MDITSSTMLPRLFGQLRDNDPSVSSELKLARLGIDDELAEELADAIRGNKTVKKLNLGYNEIGAVGLNGLFRALEVNTRIEELNVEGQKSRPLDLNVGEALASCLASNSALKRLVLHKNQMTDDFVSEMSKGLASNKTIQSIDLAQTGLTDNQVDNLCRAAIQATSLVDLSLARNENVTAAAGSALANLIKGKNISSLNLSGCSLANEGIAALSRGIAKNPSLRRLDVSYNKWGDQGGRQLQQAVADNHVLAVLSHDGNDHSSEVANAIEAALAQTDDEPSAGVRISQEILMETFMLYANEDFEMPADDLGTAIRALGWNPSEADVVGYINEADRDASGTISYDEFEAFVFGYMENVPVVTRDELQKAFRIFDLEEDDNAITVAEMTHLLKKMGDNLTDEECKKLIAKVDANNDGVVEFAEFAELLQPLDLRHPAE